MLSVSNFDPMGDTLYVFLYDMQQLAVNIDTGGGKNTLAYRVPHHILCFSHILYNARTREICLLG
jgi:hypothetical protein